MCRDAKRSGLKEIVVTHPSVIGDNYEEVIESLSRLAEANLSFHAAKPKAGRSKLAVEIDCFEIHFWGRNRPQKEGRSRVKKFSRFSESARRDHKIALRVNTNQELLGKPGKLQVGLSR